jgi:hypothetical protein
MTSKNLFTGGKSMTNTQLLGALAGIAVLAGIAQAGPPVRVGIGFNIGGPVYRPYYGPYYRPYYYYPPPAIVVAPPPPQVIYQPAPVVVQQQPVYSAPPVTSAAPPPPQQQVEYRPVASTDTFLANLRSPDENVRRDSVLELGRMKATTAVQPITATMAGDQSPVVREAAARSLGLIGSPNALTALLHAAQADPDRDVRRSAQFSVEVIRTNTR